MDFLNKMNHITNLFLHTSYLARPCAVFLSAEIFLEIFKAFCCVALAFYQPVAPRLDSAWNLGGLWLKSGLDIQREST